MPAKIKLNYLHGSKPEKCDLCQKPLKAAFVDGGTRDGPWAIMCLQCHCDRGTGFGTGFGQLYALQTAGTWLKVKG